MPACGPSRKREEEILSSACVLGPGASLSSTSRLGALSAASARDGAGEVRLLRRSRTFRGCRPWGRERRSLTTGAPKYPRSLESVFPRGPREPRAWGCSVGTGQQRVPEGKPCLQFSKMRRMLCSEAAATPCAGSLNGGFWWLCALDRLGMFRNIWGQEVIIPWPSRTQAGTGLWDWRGAGLWVPVATRESPGPEGGDEASLSLEPAGSAKAVGAKARVTMYFVDRIFCFSW